MVAQASLAGIPLAYYSTCNIAADGTVYAFYQEKPEEVLFPLMMEEDAAGRLGQLYEFYNAEEEALLHQVDPYYQSCDPTSTIGDGAFMLPDGRWVYSKSYTLQGLSYGAGIKVGLAEK